MIIKKLQMGKKSIPKVCILPRNLFSSYNIKKDKKYRFHLGNFSDQAFIYSSKENNDVIYFSSGLLKSLNLHENINLNIWVNDKDIFIGPAVGILLRHKQLSRIPRKVFDTNIDEYIKANKKANCFLFFFSAKSIDTSNSIINGYIYNYEKREWIYRQVPIPDVIYDLGVRLEEDEINSAKFIRKQLRYRYNIQFLNNCFQLDKWSTHERLSKHTEIKGYLPETIIYKGFSDVRDMLKKFNFIFLKSIDGCSGKEVLSISYNKGVFELHYYDKGLKIIKITEIDKLKYFVEKFIAENVFIIQEGVQLIKYNDNYMDLRIIIQKDINGRWKVKYYGTRIARDKSTITNYSTGGEWTYLENIYEEILESSKDVKMPLIEEIGEQTIKIASIIEKEFGLFGELGMDIAIDGKGKLWFIEANATPDKTPLETENINGKILSYYLSILEYSIYLAKHKKNIYS